MRKAITGAAALAMASAMVANAAILSVGPPTTSVPAGPAGGGLPVGPWSLVLPFTFNLSTGSIAPWSDSNWEVTVEDSILGPFHTITIEGTHLVAPHPGESAPGPVVQLGVLFPAAAGAGGTAYGVVNHHSGLPLHGGDDWFLSVLVNPDGLTGSGTVYAWHHAPVPEPSTYALVAGLGLVGFGAYRRFRTV